MLKQRFSLSLALLLTILVFPQVVVHAKAAPAPTFSLSISDKNVSAGDDFQVTVTGKQVTDLYAYEVNVTYDSSRLKFVKSISGSNGGFTVEPVVKGNAIQLAHTQLGNTPGRDGEVKLATLIFHADSQGKADIVLDSVKLVNSKIESAVVSGNSSVSVNIKASNGGSNGGNNGNNGNSGNNGNNGNGGNNENTGGNGSHVITIVPQMKVDPATNTVTSTIDAAVWKEAENKAKSDPSGKKTISIDVQEASGAIAYVQQLPSPSISTGKKQYQIEIKTSIASILIPSNMFRENELTDSEVGLRIARADIGKLDERVQKKVGAHPVIELSIQAGDKVIAFNNPKTPVTVSIPYSPTAEERKDPEHIVVWYIDGKGDIHSVPNGKYNPATGQVTFTTTHFSTYAISFVQKTFDDIASVDWAKKQIEVLASKGIINGIADNQFGPAKQVTRADFLVLLVRTLDLQGPVGDRFADVEAGSYYDEASRIARGMGITDGSGDNVFNPHASITREDMMVLTERALRMTEKLTIDASQTELVSFTDASEISGYAANSVAALVQSGLVDGYGGGIHPKETTTRAEAAKLMYSIYQL
ncbi:S-layer homology domain-containing protein [Paenibacillus contaminans]|nr:S-layer homology domain-containing protein [Paenibacillus contaminans]